MAANSPKSRGRLVRAAIQQLESLQAAGLTHLPRARPIESRFDCGTGATGGLSASAAPARAGKLSVAPDASAPEKVGGEPQATADDRAAALAEVQRRVVQCTLCGELAATRTQTVFGEGNPRARLAFLGEAPGADEDRTGRPFVGKAGQLLTRIIQACGLKREDVYIFNTLKCRPPGNRNPLPSEAANCRQYLDRQLEIIRPEFICCLGAVAAQNLLATDTSIGRLRGKFHDFHGIKVVCTYHPAYLLRNPDAKRYTWDDMKILMAEMGIAIPGA